MLFLDPPNDSRPSIPLEALGLPFEGCGATCAPVPLALLPMLTLLLVLLLTPPPEDCLLIAVGVARADTFTKRGLESTNVSQASSVSSDHRVNSCDDGSNKPGVVNDVSIHTYPKRLGVTTNMWRV